MLYFVSTTTLFNTSACKTLHNYYSRQDTDWRKQFNSRRGTHHLCGYLYNLSVWTQMQDVHSLPFFESSVQMCEGSISHILLSCLLSHILNPIRSARQTFSRTDTRVACLTTATYVLLIQTWQRLTLVLRLPAFKVWLWGVWNWSDSSIVASQKLNLLAK